jgi:ABC-2 type transport system ATP-binding protein
MPGNIIEIKDMVKKFGDFTAVAGISLYVKEGEIFGLLGPNGAGKTTTINTLLGLLEVTSGSIKIAGMDMDKEPNKIKQMIGLMTQETVVEPDLTAWENLEIFAELYHIREPLKSKRIEQALRDAGLSDKANVKAGTFSGGMQRRLELVKSMIQDPRILILDEPTTGLDVQNRVNMWERIRQLNAEGVTIILTTQYLEEADTLCDRIAIIDHGKIKAMGTASDLKSMVSKGTMFEVTVRLSDADKAFRILKAKLKIQLELRGDKIMGVLEKSDPAVISKAVSVLEEQHIQPMAIGTHLPTMNDVFIKLTGSAMRDETGENISGRDKALARGMR